MIFLSFFGPASFPRTVPPTHRQISQQLNRSWRGSRSGVQGRTSFNRGGYSLNKGAYILNWEPRTLNQGAHTLNWEAYTLRGLNREPGTFSLDCGHLTGGPTPVTAGPTLLGHAALCKTRAWHPRAASINDSLDVLPHLADCLPD